MVKSPDRAAHIFVLLDQLRRRAELDMQRLSQSSASMQALRGSTGRILSLVPPEGARQTALAEGAWITKQSLGERIREMEEFGLVTTHDDPTDKRVRLVRRTPRGHRTLSAVEATMAAMETEWSAKVGPDRYALFRSVLEELVSEHPTERQPPE